MLKTRAVTAEFQIKNSTFIKVAPTQKYMKLLERTPEIIRMKVLTKNTGVPYCETFGLEEDWYVVSKPKTKCCIVRLTSGIKWYKSTMMKGMIKSSSEAGTKEFWDHYQKWLVEEKKMGFVEIKRPSTPKDKKKIKTERVVDTRKVDKPKPKEEEKVV